MISADHPRFSCTSDMSLTIYGKIFSGPLVHTNDPSGTGVIELILLTFFFFFYRLKLLKSEIDALQLTFRPDMTSFSTRRQMKMTSLGWTSNFTILQFDPQVKNLALFHKKNFSLLTKCAISSKCADIV